MIITQTIQQTLSNTSFVKSFQCFKKSSILNYLITIMYDLAYYLIFAFVIFTFIRYVLPKATFLFKAKTFVEGMQNLPAEQLISMAQQMENSIYFTGALTIIFLLLMLFSFSFFKGLVWSKIQNIKYTFKTFLRLCITNLILSLLFILLLFFAVYFVDASNQMLFMLLFALPLTIYLSHIGNAVSSFETKIKAIIVKFFKTAFARIYLFIIPYAILLFIFVILIKIMITINFLPPKIYYLLYLLLFVSYSCWAKQYLWLVIKRAKG